jgi:hypothetical protein
MAWGQSITIFRASLSPTIFPAASTAFDKTGGLPFEEWASDAMM